MTFQIDCSAKTTLIKKLSAVAIVLLATGLFGNVATQAANVIVTVTDGSEHSLADVAVYAEQTFGMPMKIAHKVEIEQKDHAFLPLVTVAQVGSEISFFNLPTGAVIPEQALDVAADGGINQA